MKKLLLIFITVILCNSIFAQADTTAIFNKVDSLINVGERFYGEGNFPEALSYYTQAAELSKNINEGNNVHYATALYYVACGYCDLGDYQNALKYHTQALELRKVILGEEHSDYAKSLNSIGAIYYYMGDLQKAFDFFSKAEEIRKKVLGEEHPDYAQSLNSIGALYSYMGDFPNALEYYIHAMKIFKKAYGEEHSDYAQTLNNIGTIYAYLGDYYKALEYFIHTSQIEKKLLSEKHPLYALSLNNIGLIYGMIGDYSNALKYKFKALEIEREAIGEESANCAATLNDIGSIYSDLEDYKNSLKYYTESIEIRKKVLGENHVDYSASLNNIALIYSKIGDCQKALKNYTQAMQILKRILGEEHPEYAKTLNNIGLAYSRNGEHKNALKYHQKSEKIVKKVYGEESADYAVSLINIGLDYMNIGDNPNSLKNYMQAKEILKRVLGEGHPYYATSLNNIGTIYYILSDYQNALNYFSSAKEIRKKVLGDKHSDYVQSLNNTGIVYFDIDDYENAINICKEVIYITKTNLIRNFSFMTTHEREAYWNTNNKYFSQNIKCLYHMPNDTIVTRTAYDAELISKGLLLASEINTANIIMESGDTSLISEYETMKAMHLQFNKEQERPIAERIYNCDSLENEIQKMERHIMEKSNEFGEVTHFIKIDWKEVQNSLKQNDVAIEFSNFSENDTTRYMALVLTKNMESPVCVPLFNDKDIARMLRGIAPAKVDAPSEDGERGATSFSTKRQGIYESTSLYNALWKPLEKYFPKNPRIYFAPSGELHQIAIEYAPTGNGKTISDKYEIYRMSSTRFLAMDYVPNPTKSSTLYGGIFYDSDTTTMKQESERYSTRGSSYTSFASFNEGEDRGSLSYLPGTKTEVDNIAAKLNKKKVKTTVYEGSVANEESFKALSGSNIPVLHIATHGFFLPTDKKLSGDQSLVQSGLLLSGANYAWQNKPLPEGIEDGILTAKEISYMDLRKTDLVVLSACQTALGEITGEGVFGLQRGFKKAGVRTIIMSLWPVDDNATLLMMTEFYANITKGMSKREAFLAAQNKVKTTAGFENPRYWAAFIMLDGNE